MAVPVIVDTVALILLEGLKTFNSERRRGLQDDHAEAIQYLNDAINGKFPTYNDADVALAKQKIAKFQVAYLEALRAENAEKEAKK